MARLHVEELEARRLLSAAACTTAATTATAAETRYAPTPVMTWSERYVSFADFEVRTVVIEERWYRDPTPLTSQPTTVDPSPALPAVSSVAPLPTVSVAPSPTVSVVTVEAPVVPSVSKVDSTAIPEPTRTSPTPAPRLLPVLPDSDRNTNPSAAAVAVAGRVGPSLTLPARTDGSASTPGPRAEVDGVFAGRSSAPAASEGEAAWYATPDVPNRSVLSLAAPLAGLKIIGQAGEQLGDPARPLLLPLPGMLNGLPGLELADVERGMRAFLDQLEEMGQSLTGHRDHTGLYLWLVAGSVAVLACEMARRQLKNPAVVPTLYGDRLPNTP